MVRPTRIVGRLFRRLAKDAWPAVMGSITDRFIAHIAALARALLDRCHGLADAHRGVGAGLAEDPYATMLACLAVTLAHLGYLDQSRLRLEEALTETRRLRHAQTLAGVLLYA